MDGPIATSIRTTRLFAVSVLLGALFVSSASISPRLAIAQASIAEVPNGPNAPSWRAIAPDLELADISSDGSLLQAPLVMVRSSLSQVRLRLIRAAEFGLERAEVRTLCRLARASACINASFFDEGGQPLGLLVSRGVLLQPLHRSGRTLTGVLKVTRAGVDVVPRSEFQMANVLEALQAGPRLIVDGALIPGLETSARSGRSAVCRDAQNRVILASSSAGFRGLTLKELQSLLLHPKVNCVTALNLDGGGSAQIFIAPRDSSTSRTSVVVANNGFDPIPVALGFFEE